MNAVRPAPVDGVRAHIRSVVESSTMSDPREIAEKVIESASQFEKREWLAEVLPGFVADVMRADRNLALRESARRTPSRSAKVAQVRDWWGQFLASRISVDGVWKPVGEMTVADVEVTIAERREQAARTLAQAERFAAILELMSKHGAATVADLPRESVEQVAA